MTHYFTTGYLWGATFFSVFNSSSRKSWRIRGSFAFLWRSTQAPIQKLSPYQQTWTLQRSTISFYQALLPVQRSADVHPAAVPKRSSGSLELTDSLDTKDSGNFPSPEFGSFFRHICNSVNHKVKICRCSTVRPTWKLRTLFTYLAQFGQRFSVIIGIFLAYLLISIPY